MPNYTSGRTETPWQSMESAPRDATVVELRCTYGIAPWYGLFQWVQDEWSHPTVWLWRSATDPRTSVGDRCRNALGGCEDNLSWRPTDQDATSYIDPTNGFQATREYWESAALCFPRR